MSNYDIVIKYREFMKERKEKMMNNEKIVEKYRMAKESDRAQRLRDLADENHCNVQTIKDILLANGVEYDELPQKGRPKSEKKVIQAQMPYEPPKPKREAVETVEITLTPEKVENDPIMKEDNSTLNKMIAELNEKIQPLQDEIERKQKQLEVMLNAYAALKELETLENGEHNGAY